MSGKLVKLGDDLELFVEQTGVGDITVLFIPGWTMSTAVFEHQLAHFASSTHFRFVCYDPRAHGQSSKTPDGHTYEQHGRDLARLIETLDLQNIVLGGWSFGTLAALSYIHQFGADRLQGLAMIDGPPKAIGKDERTEWFTYHSDDADGSLEFFTMGRLRDKDDANERFARWMLEDESPENIAWIKAITNRMPDAAASLLNATSVYCDYESDLKNLNSVLPLLYVLRESRRDAVTAWASRYTPAAMTVGFGEHLMFWERPREFNAALDQFLTTIKSLK